MQSGEVQAFQQPQNLHGLAPAVLVHPRLHQAAQRGELAGQVPALERSSLIQRVDLLLDQRQVMQRIEDDVFAFPAPRMAGDDLAAAADHHRVDVAANPDILMPVGDRDRSEEHTSELQSLMRISYAVFCLKKKTKIQQNICTRTYNIYKIYTENR